MKKQILLSLTLVILISGIPNGHAATIDCLNEYNNKRTAKIIIETDLDVTSHQALDPSVKANLIYWNNGRRVVPLKLNSETKDAGYLSFDLPNNGGKIYLVYLEEYEAYRYIFEDTKGKRDVYPFEFCKLEK